MKQSTLCYFTRIENGSTEVLLGKKLRGRDIGKYNGYGGKQEVPESVLDCLNRECQEEGGITPVNPTERGQIRYEFFIPGMDEQTILTVYVFTATGYLGNLNISDEMEPHWFDINQLPWNRMEANDQMWLPKILSTNMNIDAVLSFDRQNKLLESSHIEWSR